MPARRRSRGGEGQRHGAQRTRRALWALAIAWALVALPCLAEEPLWRQTSGPAGAQVYALQADPARPGVLYAGTRAGLFRSQDGGASWRLALPEVAQSIAFAPASPIARVLVGTQSGQVYQSADAGETWELLGSVSPSKIIWALAAHPSEPAHLFAGSDALYRSLDGGRSWSAQPLAATRVTALALAERGDAMYVGTDQGLFISRDGGLSWQAAEGLPAVGVESLLCATPSPIVLAGTQRGLYRSADAGQSWQAVGGEKLSGPIVGLAQAASSGALYAAVRDRGLARSEDGGATWELISVGSSVGMVTALATDPGRPGALYAGTGAGILRSGDAGASWEPASAGLVGSDVQALLAWPEGRGRLVAATHWGMHYSDDGGQSWSDSRGSEGLNVLALAEAGPLYAGTWGSQVYRSDDRGASWRLACDDVASGAPVTALAALSGEPGAPRLVAGTDGAGVYWSQDQGATWEALGEGLADASILSLAAVCSERCALYAGTRDGLFRAELASSGKRPAWQRLAAVPAAEVVAVLAVDSGQVVYAALPDGLYRTEDNGKSWAAVGARSLAAHDAALQCLAARGGSKPALYAGTDAGILASRDGGQTWAPLFAGGWVSAVLADPAEPGQLYAAVRDSGVWAGVDRLPAGFPWAWLGVGGLVAAGAAGGLWWARRNRTPEEPTPVQALEEHWEQWDAEIGAALMASGRAAAEALPSIPLELRPGALQCYREVHPEQDLTWRAESESLELPDSKRVETFLRNWRAAQDSLADPASFRAATSRLINQLCNFMGFTRVTSRTYKQLHAYVVEGPTLRLRLPPRFPIIFMRQSSFGPEDIQDLRNVMDVLHMTSYFALVLVFGADATQPSRAADLRELAKTGAHDFVVLDFPDVFGTIAARRREQHLTRLLLQQIDLAVVCPYVTFGPVPESMFFGRDAEIKTILRTVQDRSFAIVGGRKIGKTSVLMQANRLLGETPGYQPFYVDCQAVQDEAAFLEAFRSRWGVDAPASAEDAFEQMLARLPAKKGDAEALRVFLLDEVDELLAHDVARQEKLFRAFRALSQENRCRFVFCGERVLNARLNDAQSPLFNFCQTLRLTHLLPADAERVILEPMLEMGIQVPDPDALVEAIRDVSSCHPNVVQYICQQLLLGISAQEPRQATVEALEGVIGSRFFAEYYMAVIWGSASPLERLITLLMVDNPLVTASDLAGLLRDRCALEVQTAVLDEALEHLVLCSVLDRQRQYYAFAAQSFPDIVEGTQDVPALIEGLQQQIAAPHPEGEADAGP